MVRSWERLGKQLDLQPGEVSTIEIHRQWRWKNDAFITYGRDTREEVDQVLRLLASYAVAGGMQPGQGTQ